MGISRRDLFKMGGVGVVGAVGASALAGRTTPAYAEGASSGIAIMAAPLSEEDRRESVDDPIYMGSQTNFAGQTLELGEGPKGQIANKAMIEKHKEYEQKLVKVTENVYQAVGTGMSTCTMIIGTDGIVIVDTGEVNEEMELNMQMFRTVTDKPVAAVLFTHDHYVGGTEFLVGKGNPGGIPLVANSVFSEGSGADLAETYSVRAMTQFGMLLPAEGEDAIVGGGLGPFMSNPGFATHTQGFVYPNTFVDAATEKTVLSFAGIEIEAWPMESDTITNVNYYLPQEKVAITNSVWPCFFNMYTLRGALYRDPRILIKNLDTILSWNMDAHCSVHGLPILGAEEVKREVTLYRDCIQLVYDQTVRFMNQGYGPNDIAEMIVFPAYMLEGFATKPIYGEIPHYVRAVYSGNVGWFGADPLELHPVSEKFEAKKIVELMGGVDNVILAAQDALGDDQFAWAAQLATYVLKGDADNAAAKTVKAQAFRKMAQVTYATNTRHYYTTYARVLEGSLSIPSNLPQNESRVPSMARDFWLNQLRVSMDPSKAIDLDTAFTVTFTDEQVSKTMLIRNCIGQVVDGKPEPSKGVELKMEYTAGMGQLVTGKADFDTLVSNGVIEVVGSAEELAQIRGLFDRPF